MQALQFFDESKNIEILISEYFPPVTSRIAMEKKLASKNQNLPLR
jgi:hypothetical protein